jgi:hypothetical protein
VSRPGAATRTLRTAALLCYPPGFAIAPFALITAAPSRPEIKNKKILASGEVFSFVTRYVSVAEPFGLAVHDHIIVGRNGHTSFRGAKLI